MGKQLRGNPATWWLLAAPVAGLTVGLVLGAVVGLMSTPPGEEIGPLAGDAVGSTVLGAVMGLSMGVFAGLAVARVELAQVDPWIPPGVAVVGAATCAWLAGRVPGRSSGLRYAPAPFPR